MQILEINSTFTLGWEQITTDTLGITPARLCLHRIYISPSCYDEMIDKLVLETIIKETELPIEEKKKIDDYRENFKKEWRQIDEYDIAYGARKRKLPAAE